MKLWYFYKICIFTGVPPSDMSQNGANSLIRAGASRVDYIKNWGLSTYKCTKQLIYEKLGKSSRTVDTGIIALNAHICVTLIKAVVVLLAIDVQNS